MGLATPCPVAEPLHDEKPGDHWWSGWPGACCLKCGTSDPVETCLAGCECACHDDDPMMAFPYKTVLPTEPGFYLFIGSNDGHVHLMRSELRHKPQVVSVTRRPDGTLTYVGDDFFYAPGDAVGAWFRIPPDLADTLHKVATKKVLGHLAQTKLAEMFRYADDGRVTRDRAIRNLSPTWTQGASDAKAGEVFDEAVYLGLVVEDGTLYGEKAWRRAGSGGQPPV